MYAFICADCVAEAGAAKAPEEGITASLPTHTALGAVVGFLAGNPVILVAGLGLGLGADLVARRIRRRREVTQGSHFGSCELCGATAEDLVQCVKCKRYICLDCAHPIASLEEKDGKQIYRPYRRSDRISHKELEVREPTFTQEFPIEREEEWEPSEKGYVLNEAGELEAVEEVEEDGAELQPAEEGDFDWTVSTSPPLDTDYEFSDSDELEDSSGADPEPEWNYDESFGDYDDFGSDAGGEEG